MTLRWEQRLASAALSHRRASAPLRLQAGLLVAHTKLRRWTRRATLAAAAMFALGAMFAVAVVASAIGALLHAL